GVPDDQDGRRGRGGGGGEGGGGGCGCVLRGQLPCPAWKHRECREREGGGEAAGARCVRLRCRRHPSSPYGASAPGSISALMTLPAATSSRAWFAAARP